MEMFETSGLAIRTDIMAKWSFGIDYKNGGFDGQNHVGIPKPGNIKPRSKSQIAFITGKRNERDTNGQSVAVNQTEGR